MKIIELTQGKVTSVDDEVYEWASKFKWFAHKNGHHFYAARNSLPDLLTRKRKLILLHREIMKPGPGEETDHKFGDTLDNRRSELRNVTKAQNARAFRKPKENTTSRFRGVHWNRAVGKWQAQIRKNRHLIHLGLFVNEEDAARAYDKAASELFGEFVQPNFPVLCGE